MKKLLPLAIFLLLAFHVPAQKIYFTDITNEWHVKTVKQLAPNGHQNYLTYKNKYYYKGDSLYNGKLYSVMGSLFVRDDTLSGKVMFLDSNVEKVLYDYTLSTGDTFYAPLLFQFGNFTGQVWHVVDKIDSLLINNTYHKRYHLNIRDFKLRNDCFADDYIVIEGIGSSKGPGFPMTGSLGPLSFNETYRGVYCFTNNGTPPPFYNCADTALNVEKESINTGMLKVYPQPATNSVTIELPIQLSVGQIEVYNATGQLRMKQPITGKSKIVINNNNDILHGLNYFRITDNNLNKIYTGKLLFQQ